MSKITSIAELKKIQGDVKAKNADAAKVKIEVKVSNF